jgi:hypothetical protein
MKVKVAAHQLSHTVAAAIETFAAMHTAEFVSFIDSLFDSTNLDEEHELISECFVNEQNPASSYAAGYIKKKKIFQTVILANKICFPIKQQVMRLSPIKRETKTWIVCCILMIV